MRNWKSVVILGLILASGFWGVSAWSAELPDGITDMLADAGITWTSGLSDEISATGFRNDRKKSPIFFRISFEVENPRIFRFLTLVKWFAVRNATLNGQAIDQPFPGFVYSKIPGIPVSYLQPGRNILTGEWDGTTEFLTDSFCPVKLFGLKVEDLNFEIGPVRGFSGDDFITISCRLNMPAHVRLRIGDQAYTSGEKLIHRFFIGGLKPATDYSYTLTADFTGEQNPTVIGPYQLKTMDSTKPFICAFLGDNAPNPEDWAQYSKIIQDQNPALIVFLGDMVAHGRDAQTWDNHFFLPAHALLASVPVYTVPGNHDAKAPVLTQFLTTPSGEPNWSQQIGPLLLIGIDGSCDWTPGQRWYQWLEHLLKESHARFIILASHYPAWTSGLHGALLHDGRPREHAVRQAQEFLMPLLKKYHVTAMFAGHDHYYERSEPEHGVTMIISGGAGSALRDKVSNSEIQNPYSRVFSNPAGDPRL